MYVALTFYHACIFTIILEGDIGGGGGGTQYRNTVGKIGKNRYCIYDRSSLFKVISISRVCLSQAFMHQQSTSSIVRKRERTSN